MKKIFFFLFLLGSLTALAQNNVTTDTTAKLVITEKGKPDGEKTELKIGREGGTLTSSDGKVRLIIPEETVSKNTTFSIQPTTNLMPNGNGKAYQMEPSGIIFQKPLQIIFYYTDAETEGNSPELLAIATQDDKGQWYSPTKLTTDTVAKTLTAEIQHFSSYVIYELAEIIPASARVEVNGSLRLRITDIIQSEGGESHTYINGIEVQEPLKVKTGSAEVWKVNGIEKGNSTVGLISASQDYTAIFQAPAEVPSQNPVAVTVQANVSEDYAIPFYRTHEIYTLVSNITIYENAYEVKMVATIIGGSPKAWTGLITYRDEGSFMVSLEKDKPAVINIKNQLEVFTNNCYDKTILNRTTCTGLLHVAGTRQIKVTPANPPGQPYPIVEIWFVPYPIELTRYTETCPPPPGVKGTVTAPIDLSNDLTKMVLLMFMGKPAFPQYIKFIAKEGKQVVQEWGKVNSEMYLIITVEKLPDK